MAWWAHLSRRLLTDDAAPHSILRRVEEIIPVFVFVLVIRATGGVVLDRAREVIMT